MSVQLDLQSIAQTLAGRLVSDNVAFIGVSTDTRSVRPGELFVALRGERFDAHDFVSVAREKGALAAVVAADALANPALQPLQAAGFPLLAVSDTRLALGSLAAFWRQRFNLPLVAVTGSNGKTTSKEMLASIFAVAFGPAVLATRGNLNNDIGLPLTLLALGAEHRAGVVEMGMNHPGEIAYLAAMARPTVGLLTNAQRAHLEGMGSVEAIAREKGSLFAGLSEDGVAVFCADDPWVDLWRELAGKRQTLCFAFASEAPVRGEYHAHGLESRLTIHFAGEVVTVDLALPGAHNARNALGAAAAALAAGVSLAAVAQGLGAFAGVKGRLQRRDGLAGAVVLDDTYNANPDSVRAGIDVLAATVGRTVLVLGDMGEIGATSGQFHDEVGGYAKSQGIDALLALGEMSALAARNFGAGGLHFKTVDELVRALKAEMRPGTTVLIKGSRFMRMERIVEAVVMASAGGQK